ncbi:hypothetical protein sS8_3944 [Methylocaldum marinum]|uniref:Uncharacterized protein n=1 Tax=Methylocaldum marinum TaxID=1432792 RepID=A0A250KWH5_9GAMM|nr:hypothetical protein sS8_3944 [Methylocaldum marinum]
MTSKFVGQRMRQNRSPFTSLLEKVAVFQFADMAIKFIDRESRQFSKNWQLCIATVSCLSIE